MTVTEWEIGISLKRNLIIKSCQGFKVLKLIQDVFQHIYFSFQICIISAWEDANFHKSNMATSYKKLLYICN